MSPREGGDLVRLGSLLPDAGPRGPASPQRRIAMVWSDVVGVEVARNAQPRTLRGGRLVVATSSSVWAQALQLMAPAIASQLNEALAASAPSGRPGRDQAGADHLAAPADGVAAGEESDRPTTAAHAGVAPAAAAATPLVREVVFRPAGWDPGGGVGAPAHLDEGVGADLSGWASAPAPGDPRTVEEDARPVRRRLTDEEVAAIEAVRRDAPDEALGDSIARAMRAALERRPR